LQLRLVALPIPIDSQAERVYKRDMQLTLDGKTIDQVAIERIQAFEPPEGYYLAFSGGKDSVTLYDLAVRSGVKFDVHYHLTTVDPPELVKFIREQYSQVEMVRPAKSMWRLAVEHKLLPIRQIRYCCQELKEIGGKGRTILTGIRWAESVRRSKRIMAEVSKKDPSKKMVHPIIDWSDPDIWWYIRERSIPYCSLYDEGFRRLGCVLCPMVEGWQLRQQIERWPKIVQAWRNCGRRVWEVHNHKYLWPDGDAYFDWWLSREGLKKDSEQATFDDCLVPFSD